MALAIGLVMLVVWIVLLTRLGGVPVSGRQRRFDLAQMTRSEKRWTLVCLAFITGLIAWLNAAATVDWGPLGTAIAAAQTGPIFFAIGLALFALVMAVGIVLSARRANRAYSDRLSSSRLAVAAPSR